MSEPDSDELVLRITTGDQEKDREFWLSKTPAERMAALEFLRQLQHGYDPQKVKVQRVLRVIERPW